MNKYEQLSVVGEGSYGIVMKCRHRETEQIVAVKKFLQTEEDATIRRLALREIRMLKRLRHENLVTMIEVFRYRKRFYIVFEYVQGTILDELEKYPQGLGEQRTRERIYQVIRAVHYCHSNQIIHRDVKPENVLVSSKGIVKICDFGFARLVGIQGEHTEYVATRWYRSPELLVSDHYSMPVDIWAIGCLFAEMITGEPLFPGDSDIDQLFLIMKLIGKPCSRHQHLMAKNLQFRGLKRASVAETNNLYKIFPTWSFLALDFLSSCLRMDPNYRLTTDELLKHNYFIHDRFPDRFLPALREKVRREFSENPLLRKFKVDLFLASSKEEAKMKRQIQTEGTKWKCNFVQDNLIRKLSTEETSSNQKTIQKLGPISKTGLTQPNSKYNNNGFLIQKSNGRLEKALDLLAKLNQTQKLAESSTKSPNFYSNESKPRSKSPILHYNKESKPPIIQTPPCSRSPNIHLNVTNISFNKEAKKSPYLVQNLSNVSIRNVLNQVPVTNPPKSFGLKRLERPVVLETVDKTGRRDSWRRKNEDDFTLPTLPGATGSPGKSKKKQSPEMECNVALHRAKLCNCRDKKKRSQSLTLEKLFQ